MKELHRAVVFCGAGASFAISKSKYPTTVQFFRDHLPVDIKDHPFFAIFADYVRSQKELALKSEGKEPAEIQIDIEEILFAATDLEDTLRRFDTDHIAKYATHHSKFQQFGLHAHNLTNPLSNARSQLTAFINLVNAHIHDVYSTIPTEQELASNWVPLLQRLDREYDQVDMFTTNYDLVLETAMRHAKSKVGLGHSSVGYTTLDLAAWSESNVTDATTGLLTKLHGSLNWTWGDKAQSRIDVGSPRHVSPDRQVAIYPGYKGEPSKNPFQAFHSYFEARLRDAESVVFVGFAFRDQYLNGIMRRAIQPSRQKIVVVDPLLDERRLPFKFMSGALLQLGFNEALSDICMEIARSPTNG